jgi:hypothetical protein
MESSELKHGTEHPDNSEKETEDEKILFSTIYETKEGIEEWFRTRLAGEHKDKHIELFDVRWEPECYEGGGLYADFVLSGNRDNLNDYLDKNKKNRFRYIVKEW